MDDLDLTFRWATASRWNDVLALFGEKGACGGCAIAPRRDYSYLGRSRVLAQVDDAPVWSISCLRTGTPSAFVSAGFVEVARRSATRPIMRFGS